MPGEGRGCQRLGLDGRGWQCWIYMEGEKRVVSAWRGEMAGVRSAWMEWQGIDVHRGGRWQGLYVHGWSGRGLIYMDGVARDRCAWRGVAEAGSACKEC